MKKEIISISEPICPNKDAPYWFVEVNFDIGEPYIKTFNDEKVALNFIDFYKQKIGKKK